MKYTFSPLPWMSGSGKDWIDVLTGDQITLMCQLGLHSHLSLENIFQSHSELAKFTDLQFRNSWKQVFLGQMASYFFLLLAICWFVYIVIKMYAYFCYENLTYNLPHDKLFMVLIADLKTFSFHIHFSSNPPTEQ